MPQIPQVQPDGAVKLTPMEMNAIHFGGLQSPVPQPSADKVQ